MHLRSLIISNIGIGTSVVVVVVVVVVVGDVVVVFVVVVVVVVVVAIVVAVSIFILHSVEPVGIITGVIWKLCSDKLTEVVSHNSVFPFHFNIADN